MSTPNDNLEINPIIKGDEIDLVALFKTIWAGRRIIYISIASCFIIGLIIAFTSPVKYTSTAIILPSTDKKASNLGGLSTLAGMAGINIGSMMGEASGISAELYPQLVNSFPLKKELINTKFNFEEYNEAKTLFEIVNVKKDPSFFEILVKYTIKLPWTIKEAFIPKKNNIFPHISEKGSSEVVILNEEEEKALELIDNVISVNYNKKSGLVNIEVVMEEALLSAQLTNAVIGYLQKFIINYKTSQVRENLDFIQLRYEEKKIEYEKARRLFFNYKDSHQHQIAERADIEYQKLSDNYEISSSILKGLTQQLEQAKITVQEETPVFTIIEPVKVPTKKSAPKRSIIVVISIFLGIFLGAIGIVIITFVPKLNRKFSFLRSNSTV